MLMRLNCQPGQMAGGESRSGQRPAHVQLGPRTRTDKGRPWTLLDGRIADCTYFKVNFGFGGNCRRMCSCGISTEISHVPPMAASYKCTAHDHNQTLS